jgi:hypothetical protein
VPSHFRSLEFRVYYHLLSVRLLAAVARGGDRPRVIAQVHHYGRHRTAFRSRTHRMMLNLPGLCTDHECHSGGHPAHRENHCRTAAQRGSAGNQQAPHAQCSSDQRPEIQPGERHSPAGESGGHKA